MSTDLQRLDFHGHDILTWHDANTDKHYASITALCRGVGVDRKGQQDKLLNNPFFSKHLGRGISPTLGGGQETLGLDIEYLQMWLAGISAERVKPEVREMLLLYQEECAKALRDYWTKGAALNPRVEIPQLPTAQETLSILHSCRNALQDLGCFDDRDTIMFGAYVRRIAATAMQPLLPPGSTDPTALDLTQPVLWSLSMRLQYLKYPPLTGEAGKSQQIRMGTMARKAYEAEFKEEPKKLWDFVAGQQRQVNAYLPDRLHVLDGAIAAVLGPPRLQIVTPTQEAR